MDININRNNESISQVINNPEFAQFLSENLPQNGFSQEEIAHLLNLFSNQVENQNRQSIPSLYSRNSIHDSIISRLSPINSSNSSKKSVLDNPNERSGGLLSDFSEAPLINDNRNSNKRSSNIRKTLNNAAPNINLDNMSTKEYENGLYQGELVDDKREGKGIMYYNCGDKYEGEYKNDEKEGKGVYISEGYTYEGEFKAGLRDGKGVIRYKTGDKYDGDWVKDKYNGRGIYYFRDGSKYEGDWKDNQPNGYGIFEYTNGDRYEGDYKIYK